MVPDHSHLRSASQSACQSTIEKDEISISTKIWQLADLQVDLRFGIW